LEIAPDLYSSLLAGHPERAHHPGDEMNDDGQTGEISADAVPASASPPPEGETDLPAPTDGGAPKPEGTSAPPAPVAEPAPAPVSPSREALDRALAEREEARSRVRALIVRLREVQADAEARANLANVLTKSLQDERQTRESLARKLEIAQREVEELRHYAHDLEAARKATHRRRVRDESAFVASLRARSETERHVEDLKEEIRSLKRKMEALEEERDEVLLQRADAVRSAVATIRSKILKEL
jgi:hypothetical protein